MIRRRATDEIKSALRRQPAVALTGPRQSGKTTLALEIAAGQRAIYLDLEMEEDRELLRNPAAYLTRHLDQLVVIDEVQNMPHLFEELRGVIDRGRRAGYETGRFLLLGSASIELITRWETLAGRIAYVDLGPFDVTEVIDEPATARDSTAAPSIPEVERLWSRGGFPRSFLAADESESFAWRREFIRSCVDRYLPELGPRLPAATIERLWAMLAHQQGGLLNKSQLAEGLDINGRTVTRYVDALVDLLLVRRLEPRVANVRKRLTRSPKVYIRDSGLVHTLLRIDDQEALLRHPIAGPSWEGTVIENILGIAGQEAIPGFYRTVAGAEIDLVLDWHGGEVWAIEIKRSAVPTPGKGFYSALQDVKPDRAFVVYPGTRRFPIAPDVEALSLPDIASEILAR